MSLHLPWKIALAAALVSAGPLFADPLPPVPDDPNVEHPLTQNAALYYWQASALMQQARRPEDIDILGFIDNRLLSYPPQIFLLRQDCTQMLIRETLMRQAMARAASMPICAFSTSSAAGPVQVLPHLDILGELTQRNLGAALLYEYVRNEEGAAEIYADLLQLCVHLGQDEHLRSMLTGAALCQQTVTALEGFIAREPSLDACEDLIAFFSKAPDGGLAYSPGPALKAEARRFGAWLNVPSEQAMEHLEKIYGDASEQPALDLLVTLGEERRRERMADWVDDYKVHLFALAGVMDQPYREGLGGIRALDKRAVSHGTQMDPQEGNPLFELLVPRMERMYDRLILAKAHWRAAEVLAHAGRYRALVGTWPESMGALETFLGRLLPRDPFSGTPFHYSLNKGKPRLVIRVPKWIARDEGLLYDLNFENRRTSDEELLTDLSTQIRQEQLTTETEDATDTP